MKKSLKKCCGFVLISSLVLLSGCAGYQAAPLSALYPQLHSSSENSENSEGVAVVVCKEFSKEECKRYLDRDVIKEGYQPVQISIQNNSKKAYLFSPQNVSLPTVPCERVADSVHTDTAGRIAGYSVGALFIWPLLIPAVVDGIKSSNANGSLDSDFADKTAKDQVLYSGAIMNALLFVPKGSVQKSFTVTLIDKETNKPEVVNCTIN